MNNIELNLRELIGNSYYSMKELREDITQAFEVKENEMVYTRYFTNSSSGDDYDVLIRAYVDNPDVEPHRIKVKHVNGEEVVTGVK